MKTKSGAKRPRFYRPRVCACGADATYAVQVLARTIGPGQSMANRRIKLGKSTLLCDRCSRDAGEFIEDLGRLGIDTLDQVRRPRPVQGSPLFDQAEA